MIEVSQQIMKSRIDMRNYVPTKILDSLNLDINIALWEVVDQVMLPALVSAQIRHQTLCAMFPAPQIVEIPDLT